MNQLLLALFPQPVLSNESIMCLMPYLILGLGGVISLILSAASNGSQKAFIFSILTILVSFIAVWNAPILLNDFAGVLTFTKSTKALMLALHLVGMFGVLLLNTQSSSEELLPEVYPLVLFSLTGMLFLVSTPHLLFQFIAIEIMSLAIYVLVAIRRTNQGSAEAGMKYFVLGGLASALFLYGSVLLYGSTGTFDIRLMSSAAPSLIRTVGFSLVLAGLFFKVGAFPFHSWLPDVYQGATMPVTGFMAAGVKIAAFVILARVIEAAVMSEGTQSFVVYLVSFCAASTMLVGNIMALNQKGLKKLFAYSSIAHTGYLLLGCLAQGFTHQPGFVHLYLYFYIFSSMGAFAVMQMFYPGNDDVSLDDIAGLGFTQPVLSFTLTVFILAMAGIPMTAGFIGKYLMFGAGVSTGLTPLVIVAVLASVIAVYYYLRVIVSLFMAKNQSQQDHVQMYVGAMIVVVVSVVATLMYGINPSEMIEFFS